MRVLLVEDEPEMASALGDVLVQHGVVLDHVATLDGAEAASDAFNYDALILDRQLPDGDGLTLIGKLRANANLVPILVLTARGELLDRIDGLDQGADDYLTKPFAVEELIARLRALMRRPANLQREIVTVGRLSHDYVNHDAVVDGQTLDLTRREMLVLESLLRRQGRMVTRAALMDAVFAMDDDVQPNALDTQVSRLRRKLSDAKSGLVINGVRGVGYLLREDT